MTPKLKRNVKISLFCLAFWYCPSFLFSWWNINPFLNKDISTTSRLVHKGKLFKKLQTFEISHDHFLCHAFLLNQVYKFILCKHDCAVLLLGVLLVLLTQNFGCDFENSYFLRRTFPREVVNDISHMTRFCPIGKRAWVLMYYNSALNIALINKDFL